MGRWRREYFCVECKAQLSFHQVMCNIGCCPLCGHLSDGMICDTEQRASKISTAWTITKLKGVRALLKPLLKLHIWYLDREKKKGGS